MTRQPRIYTASNGTVWTIEHDPPPVGARNFDWFASFDDLIEYGPTREAAIEAVEDFITDFPDWFEDAKP